MNCAYAQPPDITPLRLLQCLPVEGPDYLEPSGLTLHDGTLYAVSDKHDSVIFEVKLEEDAAKLIPHLNIRDAGLSGTGKLDFEGITCDDEGRFYLASESRCRILQVGPGARQAAWLTEPLWEAGKAKGLFRQPNAGLEGIARVGPGKFVLCAERQPRGLIEVNAGKQPVEAVAHLYDESKFAFGEGRSPDYAGLFHDGTDLYALVRNAYVISRLIKNESGYEEGPAWSYEVIVTEKSRRYVDMRYGKAEGLCMDAERVYIILDNNGIPRADDPKDWRPLLLIMERPKGRDGEE